MGTQPAGVAGLRAGTARLANLPMVAIFGVLPFRCSLLEPSQAAVVATAPANVEVPGVPKDEVPVAAAPTEHAPTGRVSNTDLPPPGPAVKRINLPDQVVVRALDVGKPALMRCFARAQKADPLLSSAKVRIHMEVDAAGVVTAVTTDAATPAFSNCLAYVARGLAFGASGSPAVVEVPMFFGDS
jgi:hypothetical protein